MANDFYYIGNNGLLETHNDLIHKRVRFIIFPQETALIRERFSRDINKMEL